MSKIIQKWQYRFNRKKVFEHGDLRLWLDTKGVNPPSAVLELERKRLGTRSKWVPYWSGVVEIKEGRATVETTKLEVRKSK